MKFYTKLLIISSLAAFMVSSCDVINPAEEIPSYIYLGAFELENNPEIDEGSLRHRIEAASIFINTEFMGIVPINTRFPILQTGDVEIKIDPVVPANGSAELQALYPFYERIILQKSLVAGEIDTIRPVTRYRSAETTIIVEDFSGDATIFTDDVDGNENTFIRTTFDGALPDEGKTGYIRLDTDNILCEVATSLDTPYDISDALQVWLEVDYRTDAPIEFALLNADNGVAAEPIYEYGINSKTTWNKVYFNLIEVINFDAIQSLRLAFRTGIPIGDGGLTLDEADIYIDNVKLLYRE